MKRAAIAGLLMLVAGSAYPASDEVTTLVLHTAPSCGKANQVTAMVQLSWPDGTNQAYEGVICIKDFDKLKQQEDKIQSQVWSLRDNAIKEAK